MTKRPKPKLAVVPEMAADKPKIARSRWWHRLRRREPTTYEKCLAVHLHFAQARSALD